VMSNKSFTPGDLEIQITRCISSSTWGGGRGTPIVRKQPECKKGKGVQKHLSSENIYGTGGRKSRFKKMSAGLCEMVG